MVKPWFRRRGPQLVCFAVCFMLMAVVAISRSDRLFGIEIKKAGEEKEETIPPLTETADGVLTVNTTSLTKDIVGFSGPTPVEITVEKGKIVKVKPLRNRETPEFYGAVVNSDLLDSWNGKTLREAAAVHPDAVTGATITSSAIIRNVETGIQYALDTPVEKTDEFRLKPDYKFFCTIIVILLACILPLVVKGKWYRIAQLVVNVVVLGFWGGTFISYSLMTGLMANGIKTWVMLPVVVMLVPAFIYPFFGRKNHYCTWICPYGSIQDLASEGASWVCNRLKLRQWKVSPRWARILGRLREALWFVLMWWMMAGIWFEWMDWEPFAAFFFKDASAVTLGVAGGFLIVSFFLKRPYCRFVCPTGTLFKISEGNVSVLSEKR